MMTLGYLDRYSPVAPPAQYARYADYVELQRQRIEELGRVQDEQRAPQRQATVRSQTRNREELPELREYQGNRVDRFA